jgi:hypothetical protein
MNVRKELHDIWCVISGKCNIFSKADAPTLFANDTETAAIYHWLQDQERAAKQSLEDQNLIEQAHLPPVHRDT